MLNRPLRISFLLIWCAMLLGVSANSARCQQLPQQCLQLPQRQNVCDNLLYKRSPIAVDSLQVAQGDIVCICMADFTSVRIESSTEQGKAEQMKVIDSLAKMVGLSRQQLVTLLRE